VKPPHLYRRYGRRDSPSLQRSRVRKTHYALYARTPVFVAADVRAFFNANSYRILTITLCRARLPRLRHSGLPDQKIRVHVRSRRRNLNQFTEALGALAANTLYMQITRPRWFRMPCPSGPNQALMFRTAGANTTKVCGGDWKTRRAFWAIRAVLTRCTSRKLMSARLSGRAM